MLADGDRVCGGKVGGGVVGSRRVVGDAVGFLVGRGVGTGVVVHCTSCYIYWKVDRVSERNGKIGEYKKGFPC
jgi:hypothetical protein